MNNAIFSSLGVNDKYLLAIYTLFNADGSETGNLKDAMGKLTGKPFVDMEMAAGILKGKGLIREGAYNWRTVKEAVAIFGVERDSIYRLVRSGKVQAVNLGERLIRINRKDLESLLPTRKQIRKESEKPLPKLYSLEPEDCYTISEVCKKYRINDSTVWAHVRKYSIPSRQIGNYVYVPKEEIDNLYKSDVL